MRIVPDALTQVASAVRRQYRAHPWVVDSVTAAAMLAVTVIWLNTYPYEPDGRHVYSPQDFHHTPYRPADAFGYALTVLISLLIAVRRWRPEPVLVTTCLALALYSAFDYPPTTLPWSPLLMFYTLASRTVPRRAAPYALLLLAVWLQYSLKLQVLGILLAVVQSVAVLVVGWIFSDQTRRLAERTERLALLTAQLREEQGARAERAVALERVRIARELHDVVAHHMSVVSVQVGLARYVLASDPETAATAMGTISDTTHEALREMRRLLAVLRSVPDGEQPSVRSAPSVEPAPGLSRLDSLLERVRTAGVEVELKVIGEPVTLHPGRDLCAYRVAQESLTNVMKYAPDARVVVELLYQTHDVTLSVTDDAGRVRSLMDTPDATRPPSAPRPAGTGNGLVGMRERARIYGGTLTAGRRAAGGFEVVLTLPLSGNEDGDGPET